MTTLGGFLKNLRENAFSQEYIDYASLNAVGIRRKELYGLEHDREPYPDLRRIHMIVSIYADALGLQREAIKNLATDFYREEFFPTGIFAQNF